jgi:hypothetical protein
MTSEATNLYGKPNIKNITPEQLKELEPFMRKKEIDVNGKEIDWPEILIPKLVAEAILRRDNIKKA